MTPVAEQAGTPAAEAPARGNGHPRVDIASQVGDIAASISRLVGLELRLALARTRVALIRFVAALVLAGMAVMVGFVALVCLYAGVFRLLTDFWAVPTAWTLLIFAGVHVFAAGALLLAAMLLVGRIAPDERAKGA